MHNAIYITLLLNIYDGMYLSIFVFFHNYYTVDDVLLSVTAPMCVYVVPGIPDNIDFLCPMSVKDLMPLVSPCADQWEMIGVLLKLDEEVDTLKKTALSSYVKMTMIFEAWAKHKKEFSWLNLLEQVKSKQELLPLVSDIKQYLTQMV